MFCVVFLVGAIWDGGFPLPDARVYESAVQAEKDIEQEWVAQRAFLAGVDMGSPRSVMSEAIGHRPMEDVLHPRLPGGLWVNIWIAALPEGWILASGLIVTAVAASAVFWAAERIAERKVWMPAAVALAVSHPFLAMVDHRATAWVTTLLVFGAWSLVRRGDWRGGLVLAPAIALRLWPGIFVPLLWMKGNRRAAMAALVGFLGLNLGAIALPHVSLSAALETLSTPTAMIEHPFNESLSGMLSSFGISAGIGMTLSALVVIVTLWISRRSSLDRGYGLMLAAAMLAAPTVWGHYLIALLPLVLRSRLATLGMAILWMVGNLWVGGVVGPRWWQLAAVLSTVVAGWAWMQVSEAADSDQVSRSRTREQRPRDCGSA